MIPDSVDASRQGRNTGGSGIRYGLLRRFTSGAVEWQYDGRLTEA